MSPQFLLPTSTLYQRERDDPINMEIIEERIVQKSSEIFSSELTSQQKRRLFNSTVIPAATYITGNATIQESVASTLLRCREIDGKIRKIAIENQIKTTTTSNQRFYLPSTLGGLGFQSIETETAVQYVRRYYYLMTNEELDSTRNFYRRLADGECRTPIGDFHHVIERYGVEFEEPRENEHACRTTISNIRKCDVSRRLAIWSRSMHYPKLVAKYADTIQFPAVSNKFLASSKLSFLNAAAEEQWYALRGLSKQQGGICRRCRAHDETSYHVVTGCKHSYTGRHDYVAYWLLRTILEATGAPDHVTRSIHRGKANLDAEYIFRDKTITIRSGLPIITTQRLHHNKPDIYVRVQRGEDTTIYILEVVVPHLQNIESEEAVKYVRYAKNSKAHVDHTNHSTVGRDGNLLDELKTMHRCPVKFGVLAMGVYGEVLETGAHTKFRAVLGELGATKGQIDQLLGRAAYSAMTETAKILVRHVG